MNVLITALSLYGISKENEYIFNIDNKEFKVFGNHTNEPVPKALQLYLNSKGQDLNKIIVLCTAAALNKGVDGLSSYQKFQNSMQEFFKNKMPEFVIIHLNDMPDSADIYTSGIEIADLLKDYISPKVYLDSTGGFRDSMMFFIAIMQLLSKKGIAVKDVLYTVYDKSLAAPYKIISRKDAYSVYDLVSGIEELKSFGDPTKVMAYFRDRKLDNVSKEILETLKVISTEMQLCRVEQSKDALLKLSQLLKKYQKNGSLFDSVVDVAERKYGGVGEDLSELDYIKWYFDHGYISQTLAFFYETLPDILVGNKIIYPSESITNYFGTKTRLLMRRQWNYAFINSFFKEHYLPEKIQLQNAKEELTYLLGVSRGEELEEIKLSETAQKVKRAIEYVSVYRQNKEAPPKETEEYLWFASALKEAQDIESEDILSKTATSNFKRIYNNNIIIRSLYGIEKPEADTPPDKMAKLIISAIDNKDIFVKEGLSVEKLQQLLEKYFYLKEQRNSVLHVNDRSASPEVLSENLLEAICLLEEVLL